YEGEQSFEILVHVRRVGKLLKAFYNRGFIAATVFLFRPAGIEHAEVLKDPVGTIRVKVEAVEDKRHAVLGKSVGRNLKAAFLCDREAEVLVGGELREFIRVPKLHDMGRAPIALRQPWLCLAQRRG